MDNVTRRTFFKGTAAAGLGLQATSKTTWAKANSRVRVACVGVRGRGKEHIDQFSKIHGVEVAALCDVDENVLNGQIKDFFTSKGKKKPKKTEEKEEPEESKENEEVVLGNDSDSD